MDSVIPDRASLLELTQQLQEQTEIPLWVTGKTSTVIAIATGEPEEYGPRGVWFSRIFSRLGCSSAGLLALQVLGGVVGTIWWLKCRTIPQSDRTATELFIGFGAGPEQHMAEQLRRETSGVVAHLNQTMPDSLANVALPNLRDLWATSFTEAQKVVLGLRRARLPSLRDHAEEWLVSTAIRFSDYVFIKAWAEALPEQVTRLVFISADIPAFAALDAGNSDRHVIEYRQHGLHKISIVLPPFRRLSAINRHDADHMRKRLPTAVVSAPDALTMGTQLAEHSATVLFISPYDSGAFRLRDYLPIIRSIMAWAAENGLHLIVRPHPSVGDGFWRDHLPELPVDNSTGGFQAALALHKPLFVIGWWSTSLVDALKSGVLPILILNQSEAALADMVFPLKELTMGWEPDAEKLVRLVNDPQAYQKTIEVLQSRL
jgi:hypothetical protein